MKYYIPAGTGAEERSESDTGLTEPGGGSTGLEFVKPTRIKMANDVAVQVLTSFFNTAENACIL